MLVCAGAATPFLGFTRTKAVPLQAKPNCWYFTRVSRLHILIAHVHIQRINADAEIHVYTHMNLICPHIIH